ncbi:MAG: periplasmic binding protein [Acidimicrobiales bacterium]|nr:periplasmic binding protein [Acidimicrobiales bacterium]
MKIVSLLPSATEIVYALGLGDSLAAVTDGCDHPADAQSKPVVSRSRLDLDEHASAGDVDGAVREAVKDGEPLYTLDADLMAHIQPDLILTQDLCRVCAVPAGQVEDALDVLGCRSEVVSLDPHTLSDVLDDIAVVGRRTGTGSEAAALVDELRARVAAVTERATGLPPVKTFPLEWLDPPFGGGHWVPDLIGRAGGVPVLCAPGEPSAPVRWTEVAGARPEVVVFMPCGYDLAAAVEESKALGAGPELRATPAWEGGRVWTVNATAYFSRPGPRLVDGLELLAWVQHPDAFPEPPPGRVAPVATG